MRLRPVGLVILILVLVLDASAASRRRAVRSPGGASPNPGTGDCITYGSPRIGMKASYLTTTAQGNVTFQVTYVSETPTQARTTQKVQTPQGNSDVETRMDFETVPAAFDLRALKHLYVKSTTVAAGFPFTVETDIDFVPSMVLGPASGWCVGAKWSVPATTETITVRSIAGPQNSTQTTIATEGEVLAIEDVTTPAGTFRCLKYRGTTASGTSVSPTINWNSIEHWITVRQEALDANGNVTQVTTLQKIE
ncbi:MAG TPA: hypothetical protein VKB93_19800 [Thermoanaerobaculia bacterium]|nr:hypothetical protein [Thermoanaerobaculia bacterium]